MIAGNTRKERESMEYRYATSDDMNLLIQSRMDTLRDVNGLDMDYQFSEEFVEASREYFREGDQSTVLAIDNGRAVACATMCYIDLMPTYAHPSGRRAHLMNVWTNKDYRRQGIAEKLVTMLIEEARGRGVSEISLDATEAGRPLYRKLGFKESGECMTMVIQN
jgi:ribosomal protein S18 acetylase RimI-like enzyme